VLSGIAGCWFGHRGLAALVASYWLVRGELPDFRWASKVLAYESTFLWAFCAFWSAIFTSFSFWNDWISRLLTGRSRAGLFEILALFGGTVVLAGVWLWRYRIAYRAIRWSNF
jgi:hypothetical protein